MEKVKEDPVLTPIFKAACEVVGVEYEEGFKKSRKTELVTARQLLAYICKEYIRPKPTQKHISHFLGVERSVISTGVKRMNDLLDSDRFTQRLLERTLTKIGLTL